MKKLSALLVIFALVILGVCQTSVGFAAAATEGKKGLLLLGSPAPDFKLPDVVTGKVVSLEDFSGKKALLVVFLCRHCPFVQRDKEGIIELAKDYSGKGAGVAAISSNDPAGYPEDALAGLKEMAVQDSFPMPLLFDETQRVAKSYTAVATPDFFIFDQDRKLVYRGQFDDARPGDDLAVTGKDVRAALDAVLQKKPVSQDQKPAVGCSIKWKPGNEPSYWK